MQKPIILGSSSIWRARVLKNAGIPFTASAADIDEKAIRFPRAEDLVRNIAVAKAGELLRRISEPSLLITADQVVEVEVAAGPGPEFVDVHEKPSSAGEARLWLTGMHRLVAMKSVTAVFVTDTNTRRSRHVVDVVVINRKKIPEDAIKRAIKRGDIMQSCGAFTLDDPDIGQYFSNGTDGLSELEFQTSVAGLPIGKTLELLESFGWRRS